MKTWAVGDEAYYFLPTQLPYRPRPLYLRVTVINVTPTRVVVRDVGRKNWRVIKATSLVETAPQGAWIG